LIQLRYVEKINLFRFIYLALGASMFAKIAAEFLKLIGAFKLEVKEKKFSITFIRTHITVMCNITFKRYMQ